MSDNRPGKEIQSACSVCPHRRFLCAARSLASHMTGRESRRKSCTHSRLRALVSSRPHMAASSSPEHAAKPPPVTAQLSVCHTGDIKTHQMFAAASRRNNLFCIRILRKHEQSRHRASAGVLGDGLLHHFAIFMTSFVFDTRSTLRHDSRALP